MGQKIDPTYLTKLMEFFEHHSLEDFSVIYDNEKIFSEFLGSRAFKFTNSGTSALYIIIRMLSEDRGNFTVWGPAFSHVSWINVCDWMNHKIDYVDVKEDTLSLDPDKLLEKILKDGAPDALVMIDMGGYVGEDTLKVKAICNRYDIFMIEDAAHAFGQRYEGQYSGTFGDYGFYSFSNPKLLTCGEGGAIVCPNQDINILLEEYIYQGGWYRHNKEKKERGLNFIMSNWMTELLKYQLEDINHIKKAHFEQFRKMKLKTPNLITFSVAAPSFFAYRMNPVPKMLQQNKMPQIMYQRYKNMGGENYPVSQMLEDELLYWKL